MTRWCPECRAEYVDTVEVCSTCRVRLTLTRPPDPEPQRSTPSFITPRPDHEDPWVPVWEGPTLDAESLALRLEASHIPVNLGEALEAGSSRVEVPRSYVADVGHALDAPRPAPPVSVEGAEGLEWAPIVRLALVVMAIVILFAIVVI